MNAKKTSVLFFAFWFVLVLVGQAIAVDQEKELQSTSKLSLPELTEQAKKVLEKKYPGEDWEKYKFPKYAYINDSVLVSYRFAVKEYKLLAKIPCYCFCEAMGHKNLAYCFFKRGVPGEFDPHAASCNTCYRQAMHALLWEDLGIPVDRMLKAMKDVYGK
jgi:hypothetical protein